MAFAIGPPPPQESGLGGIFDVPDTATGDDRLTVMVWIHGGANKLGRADSPGYEAQHLARDGDVVVVTFNHRVGRRSAATHARSPCSASRRVGESASRRARDRWRPADDAERGCGLSDKAGDHADRWGRLAPFVPLSLFSPSVDAEILPTARFQAPAAGTSRDVELIAGHHAQEHRLFFLPTGPLGETPDAQATVLPRVHLTEAQVQGGGRAFVYEPTWPAPGQGGVFGACCSPTRRSRPRRRRCGPASVRRGRRSRGRENRVGRRTTHDGGRCRSSTRSRRAGSARTRCRGHRGRATVTRHFRCWADGPGRFPSTDHLRPYDSV
ncbi:carboxylesterase family protein [Streptomyces sp. NPDC059627]